MAALRPSHDIDPSKLAVVERGDLARVVVATGKIQPLSKADIKSKASGIVKKIYVDYGDRVKIGDIELVVRELRKDQVVKVGLEIEPEAERLPILRFWRRVAVLWRGSDA